MRISEEEESSWFARWEEQLPSPEELMPLSQTLITPDLALAFDIPFSAPNQLPPPPPPPFDLDSSDLNPTSPALAGSAADEPARTLKRPRLVWIPQLHKRFVDAVAHLGIKNAVPKTIMQLMSVDGLTRENVASHLQKYRLYLKRMQGLGGSGAARPISAVDAATDQLFASTPVPQHFLSREPIAAAPDPFFPFAALQHQQQITSAVQQQLYHQRHLGHFGPLPIGGGVDQSFPNRVMPQSRMHQPVGPSPGMGLMHLTSPPAVSFADDSESAGRGSHGERKVLTLFPTEESRIEQAHRHGRLHSSPLSPPRRRPPPPTRSLLHRPPALLEARRHRPRDPPEPTVRQTRDLAVRPRGAEVGGVGA